MSECAVRMHPLNPKEIRRRRNEGGGTKEGVQCGRKDAIHSLNPNEEEPEERTEQVVRSMHPLSNHPQAGRAGEKRGRKQEELFSSEEEATEEQKGVFLHLR